MSTNSCLNFMRNGNYNAAIKCYENYLKKDKDNPHILYQIGKCYLSMNKYKQAYKYFDKATKIKPDESDFWLALGTLYMTEWKNDYRKANDYFKKSLILNPTSVHAMFLMGLNYVKMGELLKAEEILISCYKTDPNFSDAIILLSNVQKQLGRV